MSETQPSKNDYYILPDLYFRKENMSEWKNALGPSKGEDTVWDSPSDTEPHIDTHITPAEWAKIYGRVSERVNRHQAALGDPTCSDPECRGACGAKWKPAPFPEKHEDPINSPSHYTATGIEAIDVIEAFAPQYAVGEYLIGSVFKYLCRAPFKGKTTQDLKKARWFLDRAIERNEENE